MKSGPKRYKAFEDREIHRDEKNILKFSSISGEIYLYRYVESAF
jgi:hypothetical protein